VLERVVENWLTSFNERQYHIPFCQLLQTEGERVIYISTHGQAELGVDVLTIDPAGIPRAYQLKRGDISLHDWRKYEGEIVQLVEYDPSNPALPLDAPHHQSFVVTNGVFKDTVLNAINQRNSTWKARGYGPLSPISKDELVSRFIKAHERYFPVAIDEVSKFFELYTEAGQAPLNKQKFASFLQAVLPAGPKTEKRHILQAASSIVLFTSYILKNKVLSNNHWAIFEAWVMAGSYILTLGAERRNEWIFSFDLCRDQATNALAMLARETADNPEIFQGSPFSDGLIYQFRRTIMCGLLSAFYLATDGNDLFLQERDIARTFFETHSLQAQSWGESAVPLMFISMLALEQIGKQSLAELLAARLIFTICKSNRKDGSGFPNPYWEPELCLKRILGLSRNDAEAFNSFSYSLESLIGFLARRWRRVALKSLWGSITEIHFAKTTFGDPADRFRWRAETAQLNTYAPNQPQSWELLRDESSHLSLDSVPPSLKEDRIFLVYFTLVYPHRFDPSIAFAIEKAAQCSS
jgi:hypothetical protein